MATALASPLSATHLPKEERPLALTSLTKCKSALVIKLYGRTSPHGTFYMVNNYTNISLKHFISFCVIAYKILQVLPITNTTRLQ